LLYSTKSLTSNKEIVLANKYGGNDIEVEINGHYYSIAGTFKKRDYYQNVYTVRLKTDNCAILFDAILRSDDENWEIKTRIPQNPDSPMTSTMERL
jgi:hypothetical protein